MAQGPFEQVGGLQALLEKPLKAIKVFHFSTFKDQVCAFAVGPDSLVQKNTLRKIEVFVQTRKLDTKGTFLIL